VTRIIPVRTGWDADLADTEGYPHDLPEDWRLAYFSNAFWGVAVPAPVWTGTPAATLRAWGEDTPERFRFYLEGQPGMRDPDLSSALDAASRALGPRLGGLVGEEALLARAGPSGCPRWLLMRGSACTAPESGEWDGLAWVAPPELAGDLRATRRWIAQRAARAPALALLGTSDFSELGRWQSLVELMGLA
jgi:hypothetical protein